MNKTCIEIKMYNIKKKKNKMENSKMNLYTSSAAAELLGEKKIKQSEWLYSVRNKKTRGKG